MGIWGAALDQAVPAVQQHAVPGAHGNLGDGRGGQNEAPNEDRERRLRVHTVGPLVQVECGY